MADDDFILPPAERGQHDEIELLETPVAGIRVARAKHELKDALFYYRNAGHLGARDIGERRWEAGMKLRLDYRACHRDKSIIAMYGEFISGTGQDQEWSDIRIAAERRYGRAALALGREALLGLLITVACEGSPAGRGRMIDVRRGLDILRKCY